MRELHFVRREPKNQGRHVKMLGCSKGRRMFSIECVKGRLGGHAECFGGAGNIVIYICRIL